LASAHSPALPDCPPHSLSDNKYTHNKSEARKDKL
jgi:hypothetical protein